MVTGETTCDTAITMIVEGWSTGDWVVDKRRNLITGILNITVDEDNLELKSAVESVRLYCEGVNNFDP